MKLSLSQEQELYCMKQGIRLEQGQELYTSIRNSPFRPPLDFLMRPLRLLLLSDRIPLAPLSPTPTKGAVLNSHSNRTSFRFISTSSWQLANLYPVATTTNTDSTADLASISYCNKYFLDSGKAPNQPLLIGKVSS